MKPHLSLLLVSAVLFSCHNTPGVPAPVALTETAVYNIDSVRLALNTGDEKASRKQLATAIDLYKNKKNPMASCPYFRKAILIKPTAQGYYELGSALLDAGVHDEALSALHIAEKLDYKPLANVVYKIAAAYAGKDETEAIHYMEVALQMGYANPEKFRTDELFKSIRNKYDFNTTYSAALNGGRNVKDPAAVLWEEFKGQFSPVQLPLVINTAWINSHPMEKGINFEYERFVPEMRNERFAREAGKEYYFFAAIKQDTAYTALCYAGEDEGLEDGNVHPPLFFYLVTYDPKGKIIDKLHVAGQEQLSYFVKVFTLQPNYTFEIREFKNIYQKDPEQAGYGADNPIVKTEEQLVSHYRIAANGKFEKTDAPLAMR
ncbi:MAG: hypothetical protein JST68_03385 [Bacteroidetes bacterium]|nr:hypothetical protein [Bacteroidota bacterium]